MQTTRSGVDEIEQDEVVGKRAAAEAILTTTGRHPIASITAKEFRETYEMYYDSIILALEAFAERRCVHPHPSSSFARSITITFTIRQTSNTSAARAVDSSQPAPSAYGKFLQALASFT